MREEESATLISNGKGNDMIRHLKNLLLLTVYLPLIAVSQIYRPENKAIVVFIPKVTSTGSDEFLYTYTVVSSTQSEEIFNHFAMRVCDNLLTGNMSDFIKPVNKKWLISGDPQGFVTGTAANRFVGIPPADGLAPGDSMTFAFRSKGLPAIKVFYAQSYAAPYATDELDSLYEAGYTDGQLFPDWRDNSYRGMTVVPHVFNEPVMPLAMLDTLVSYKHQAFTLGWIKEEGMVTSLDAKLEAARPQIIADRPSAKQILQSFVLELDGLITQSGQITSEAYALLKFNAQYLISKL